MIIVMIVITLMVVKTVSMVITFRPERDRLLAQSKVLLVRQVHGHVEHAHSHYKQDQ